MKKVVRPRAQVTNKSGHDDGEQVSVDNYQCQNHQGKTASHRLLSEDQQLYYCEKCSIMLASQGFNVLRLDMSVSNACNNRLYEIQNFMGSLQQQLEMLSGKYTQIEDTLVESEIHHSQLLDKAKHYFKSLEQIIELQKYLAYNMLLNKRDKDQGGLRILKDNLKLAILQVQDMMNDIQNNLDAVEGVEDSIYQSIMLGYKQKLAVVPVLVDAEFMSPSKYQLSLPSQQVSALLYSLADQIALKTIRDSGEEMQLKEFYSNSLMRYDQEADTTNHCLRKSQSEYLPETVSRRGIRQNQNLQNAAQMGSIHDSNSNLRFSFESKNRDSNNTKPINMNCWNYQSTEQNLG